MNRVSVAEHFEHRRFTLDDDILSSHFQRPRSRTHISTTPHPQLQLLLDISRRCIYQIVQRLTPNPRNGITTTAISCVSTSKGSRPLRPRYLCDDDDRYIRNRLCSRRDFFSLITFALPSLFVRGFGHSLGRWYCDFVVAQGQPIRHSFKHQLFYCLFNFSANFPVLLA